MEACPPIPDFELIKRIGSGSYGDVWLARSVTGIYRAVKIVDRSRFQDSRPFLREFDGIKRFQKAVGSQHQQLALLHVGCDEHAGLLYYVMELADDITAGTDIDPATYIPATLKELRRQRAAPFPTSECVSIGVNLGSALAGLHNADLIHRDVKPSNIIFVGGIPKLADVGLVASSEQTLTSLGTPGYAPPEGGGNAQGDIYSLGKILYELATGLGPDDFPRVPFSLLSGDTASQLLELNEVILRACNPIAANRYPHAQAIVEELRLLQAGRSVKELHRNRRRLHLLTRVIFTGGLLSIAGLGILGAQNYISVRRLAEKETSLRHLAEANDRMARYTSDLHLARLGFSAGDLGATRAALRRQTPIDGNPDLRGFEWYALQNETKGDFIAVGGEIGGPAVSALALSPDERVLAVQVGERTRDTVLWELASHQRALLAEQTYGLGSFSANGELLTIATVDKHVFRFQLPDRVRQPDQMVTGRLQQNLPDGYTLLLKESKTTDSRLIIWDSVNKQTIADWGPEHREYKLSLSAATLSSNHHLLAASYFGAQGALRSRELIVYDLIRKTECFRLTDIVAVQWLRFSPDSQWLAIAMANQPTRIVSAVTGATSQTLLGQDGVVRVVEFSPNGQMLASAGEDRSLYIWDVSSGKCLRILRGHEAEIISLAWFSDNSRLVTGSRDGTWREWSLSEKPNNSVTGKLWTDILGDFLFAKDGRSLAVTDATGRLAILDTHTLERIALVEEAFQPLLYEDDGQTLLALTKENTLVRYNLLSRTATTTSFHIKSDQKLVVVETSLLHHMIAFGFDRGAIEIWDPRSGQIVSDPEFQLSQIGALAWAPDREELIGGGGLGKLSGKAFGSASVSEQHSEQKSAIYSLGYSPSGDILAIGRADGRVALGYRRTGAIIGILDGHRAPVSALAFSPDGSRLVTGGKDGLIIFWSINQSNPIAVWAWDDNLGSASKPSIYRLKFDPTGTRLGIMTDDGRLRIWDATP